MIPKNTRVLIRPTASGLTSSYPAANWLGSFWQNGGRTIVILEDAPNENTLDVIDVLDTKNDQLQSIYDFNIVRAD